MKANPNHFNRFTTLPVLFYMLSNKCITLLEPKTWEDRNDALYLEKYQSVKKLKTLLACCLSLKRETFHHWKVFSNGSSGVCVEFHKQKLLSFVNNVSGVRCDKVKYLYIKDNKQPDQNTWPFLKRKIFEDEGEFRIIYENEKVVERTKDIPFDLNCINKITLAPWMPISLTTATANAIKTIGGCSDLKIHRSTLLESDEWQKCLPN